MSDKKNVKMLSGADLILKVLENQVCKTAKK